MQSSGITIRFPGQLGRADVQALRRLERDFSEVPVSVTASPATGRPQVRCTSGEIYHLDAVPKFRFRQLARRGFGPGLPPAPAMALRAA